MASLQYSSILSDTNDEKISWFVGVYFISSTANMTMKTIFPIPENLWGLVSLFWGFVIAYFMLKSFKVVWRRSKEIIGRTIFAFVALIAWSLVLITLRGEPTKILISSIGIPTLMFWIPVGIYASTVKKTSILYDVMLKSSYILTALLIICYIFRTGGAEDPEQAKGYNMFWGYSMAFASLFQLNEFFRSRNRKLLYLFVTEFLLILSYANRGALLSIGFFIFFKFIMDQSSLIKKIVWTSLLGTAVGMLILFAEPIANYALQYMTESRTLSKMASESLTESDARDDLRAISIDMIKERPILGWGVGGECYTIGHRFAPGNELSHGHSSHNGIIQHLLYFGVLGGTVVNILLIWPIFRLHRMRDEYRKGIILVSCSAYFITTLISSCDILLKPAVAVYIYLSYFYKKNKVTYTR